MTRKGGRRTTEEELKLWRAFVRGAEPLHERESAPKPQTKPEAPPVAAPPPSPPPPEPQPRRNPTPSATPAPPPAASVVDFANLLESQSPIGARRVPERSPVKTAPAAPFVAPLGPRTPGLDRRTAERLMKGDKRPEARVDLHGMTLERAHATLIWFILESRHAGRRLVLVVTGKGGDYQARASGQEGERRGTLRDSTPRWLSSPPLSGHVGGVYQAHERHGGAGARYVYLRKA